MWGQSLENWREKFSFLHFLGVKKDRQDINNFDSPFHQHDNRIFLDQIGPNSMCVAVPDHNYYFTPDKKTFCRKRWRTEVSLFLINKLLAIIHTSIRSPPPQLRSNAILVYLQDATVPIGMSIH